MSMSLINTPSKQPSSSSTPLATSQPPSLPPPQTFDILPPLHALISRLIPSASPSPDQQPLEPQHLATEASAIKIRIQKAKAAVEALADIDRTIAEQDEEIKELEQRISSQKEVLKDLAIAGRGADADVEMRGAH
ncbi:MAG: hypothetical protein M1827_000140 [Pycnora praestabilis]|nr:MAG: hypothetical protein M1827_000140 [Pycnora praestabilis]